MECLKYQKSTEIKLTINIGTFFGGRSLRPYIRDIFPTKISQETLLEPDSEMPPGYRSK